MAPHDDRRSAGPTRPASARRDLPSVGAILRRRVPATRGSDRPAAPAPAPALPSWGRRLLGAALLLGTVTLVSCQALLAAFSPGLYR